MTSNRSERHREWYVHLLVIGTLATLAACAAQAQDAQLTRGKYPVTFAGCTDCHTPGHFLGKPDMTMHRNPGARHRPYARCR